MTWADHHKASEAAAIEADRALREGNTSRSSLLYAKAAEDEEQALGVIEPSKVRTRGITAVSAVSLWYKAATYERAAQLAYSMLADPHLPEFAKTDLKNLIQAVWTEESKKSADVKFLGGQVFVSVKGGEIITGGAPLDLIVEKVQTIQSLFYRTIEFIKDMPFRHRGGPIRDIQESCRPWLFQAAPGSYQFSVAIQEPTQRNFFKPDARPELVARQFLEILKATASDDRKELETAVPNAEYRNVFLKLCRNLAPTGKTFDSIELRTATGDTAIGLTPEARTLINQALKSSRPADPGEPSGNEEELVGILRAVDLDKDFLDIHVNSQTIHVVGLGDAMDDVIGPMVNKPVKARVVKGVRGLFRLRDIELDD